MKAAGLLILTNSQLAKFQYILVNQVFITIGEFNLNVISVSQSLKMDEPRTDCAVCTFIENISLVN